MSNNATKHKDRKCRDAIYIDPGDYLKRWTSKRKSKRNNRVDKEQIEKENE